jgi:very-short-patch-repair endonuclease
MAAVLACGPEAALSHRSAAELFEICPWLEYSTQVTVPAGRNPRPGGVVVHRRRLEQSDLARREGIRLTNPLRTLLDLAAYLPLPQVEAATNEAARRDLVDLDLVGSELNAIRPIPGKRLLLEVLDSRWFRVTDSELERRFLRLVRRAGLPVPKTGRIIRGFKTDFYWPEFGLVVETDGLRYHRDPAQQARDRLRDQVLTARGLTVLRFTHRQVWYDGDHVIATLAVVIRRCDRRHLNG